MSHPFQHTVNKRAERNAREHSESLGKEDSPEESCRDFSQSSPNLEMMKGYKLA